jgi:16S rRNA (cytosine967-C5)-methyltransferase
MLYATCSIFPQECGQQAEAFAARHADAQALPAPGQILPLERDGAVTCDGFFYALFAKKA